MKFLVEFSYISLILRNKAQQYYKRNVYSINVFFINSRMTGQFFIIFLKLCY